MEKEPNLEELGERFVSALDKLKYSRELFVSSIEQHEHFKKELIDQAVEAFESDISEEVIENLPNNPWQAHNENDFDESSVMDAHGDTFFYPDEKEVHRAENTALQDNEIEGIDTGGTTIHELHYIYGLSPMGKITRATTTQAESITTDQEDDEHPALRPAELLNKDFINSESAEEEYFTTELDENQAKHFVSAIEEIVNRIQAAYASSKYSFFYDPGMNRFSIEEIPHS